MRRVAWILGLAAITVLLLRAGIIAVLLPYLIWKGFREGGYPWWAQTLAVAVVVGVVAYGIWRSLSSGHSSSPQRPGDS